MSKVYIKCKLVFMALFFSGALYAQDIDHYWSHLEPDEMSDEISGVEIMLCTAIKMLILPEAKKNTAYKHDVVGNNNVARYMNEYCPAQNFTLYAQLLDDLQDDILTTQKILKASFSKKWTMKDLERDFVQYFETTEREYQLNCYTQNMQLSVRQKYILHLAIIELQSKDFFGHKINGSSQRQVILKLFERVYGLKKIIDQELRMDQELATMIVDLKKIALLEAKNHSLIQPDLYEQLKITILN